MLGFGEYVICVFFSSLLFILNYNLINSFLGYLRLSLSQVAYSKLFFLRYQGTKKTGITTKIILCEYKETSTNNVFKICSMYNYE